MSVRLGLSRVYPMLTGTLGRRSRRLTLGEHFMLTLWLAVAAVLALLVVAFLTDSPSPQPAGTPSTGGPVGTGLESIQVWRSGGRP